MKRVFLFVLDSCGAGEMPDAHKFGDYDVNTLRSCATSKYLDIPNLRQAGLGNVDGLDFLGPVDHPTGAYGKLSESSMGKDTTIGHWEIAGIVSPEPLPTYPNGFPPEVILLLVNYCVSETTRKYGPGRRPTMRFVEKTAFTWEREEIVTLEQAETYIRRREERRSAMEQIKRALQIRDRELSPTERQYVDSWIEKGFTPDAVEIAYDRTIIKTERRAWPYMNSILNAWHDKGLHTAEEILSAEQPAGPKSGTPGAYAQAGSADAERDHMRRLLRELNKE